jgi:hypothetical protein
VVREEQIVDIQRMQTDLRHLVGSCRSTIKHDLPATYIDYV